MKNVFKCPGQETQFWTPDDIFETDCPHCGKPVEFFKDDRKRDCPNCHACCVNPKLNLGCLEWCQYADKCQALFNEEGRKES